MYKREVLDYWRKKICQNSYFKVCSEKEPALETIDNNIYDLQVAASSDITELLDANKTISALSPMNPGSPTQEATSGTAITYSNNVPSSSKLCSTPKQSQNNSCDGFNEFN